MKNLGVFYSETKKYDRAIIAYQHAVDINPNSAEAYFGLARAEENTFDFAAADLDYAHAIQLAPNDKVMRQTYAEFQQRKAQARKQMPAE